MVVQDPKILAIVEEFGSEAAFIKFVGDATDAVSVHMSAWVNFKNLEFDFNIEYIDIYGKSEDSFDSAILKAICGKQSVESKMYLMRPRYG